MCLSNRQSPEGFGQNYVFFNNPDIKLSRPQIRLLNQHKWPTVKPVLRNKKNNLFIYELFVVLHRNRKYIFIS